MDITGKIALITGSGQGIGKGIATAFANHGARVVTADRNLRNAMEVESSLNEIVQNSMAIKVDVTNQSSVNSMIQQVIQKFGRIDILVNNAGIIAAPGWEEREHPNEEDWEMVYEVNLRGVARVMEAVAPLMKNKRYGKIINISSGAGRRGSTHPNPPYNASKAAVISMTQSLAMELASFNINVNAICPGPLWTPMADLISYRRGNLQGLLKTMTPRQIFDKYVNENVPLGRPPMPDDIGNMAAFLASDYSMNITGQTINVNGGSLMN
jgi:NAD(P)-dependent dehydrogenase (short-subunit alcohol dehydrogenase family)